MIRTYYSPTHIFSIDDLTGTYGGVQYPDNTDILDTAGAVVTPYVDKSDNVLYAIDSEFGFYVDDFTGAEDKELDGDYAEGFAGNIYDDEGTLIGIALRNAPTEIFLSGAPFGTWSMGLGGTTVKASTEHYETMVSVLSDQAYPGDPDALGALDNDLKMMDLRPNELGIFEVGAMHDLYVKELTDALQQAMDSADPLLDTVLADIDFDRDGEDDTYRITKTTVQYDHDGDGVAEDYLVGAVDLGNDGTIDIIDSVLNGYGGEADVTDLLEPNESSVTYDIAYSQDYSVTLKDDGKLLYRWGEAVKRPNDIRMEVNIALPDEWTADENENGIADGLEDGGFTVTRAELIITHDITNNPNDQVRPEDYENEAAIGRLPSYYIIQDPDDPTNTLWVSPLDSYDGTGAFLPSYFVLTGTGEVDMSGATGTAVYDPDGVLVGYRNDAVDGTIFRDESKADLNELADLDFTTEDLEEGFTAAWYTTIDREPFEWSYDMYSDNPYINVYESFRTPEEAAAAGYTDEDLVSGPRWRLTPNKFGQDLPGLEIPLEENSPPPFTKDNIKYDTGELITTTLNLLDWEGDSPLADSIGWMSIDAGLLDENADGLIDEGWSMVNGSLGEGDAVPLGLILSGVTPNGVYLEQDFLDTAIYLKGDRQDATNIYDIQLVIEYETDEPSAELIGAVQEISELDHIAQTVTYEGGATFDNVVLFATPATLNGQQMVTVEFSEITATGATFYLEEPEIYNGAHKLESVALLAFEEGVWELEDGSILQVGTTQFEAGATNVFHDVAFEEAFDDVPIVLLQVQTNNGSQFEIARADNITTTGFSYAIQEQEATEGYHTSEIVGWVALDAFALDGVIDWGDITAQAFSTGDIVTEDPTGFTFNDAIGLDPLVSAIVATANGLDTANLRLADLTDDGVQATVDFLVSEERSLDSEVNHKPETVNGLAFEEAGLLMGTELGADDFLFA